MDALVLRARAARDRLAASTGWRRAATAIGLGAFGTLALPPFHAVPVLAVALVLFLWLLDGATRPRQAFWDGWCFGFGHFVAGLYWFAHALLTDAEKFAWLIPLAISVIPAVLAAFSGVVALATWRFGGSGWRRVVVFAAFWTFGEWLRSWVLTGLPWNLAGYVWAFSDPINQFAALGGIYGLSLISVAALASPTVFADCERPERIVALAALALSGVWIGGSLRLPDGPAPVLEEARFRLVQPNIAQHHKWLTALRERHLRRHVDLTMSPGWERINHVVWPEAAIPYFLDEEPDLAPSLGRIVPKGGVLFTGAPRISSPRQAPIRLWNSVEAIASTGALVARYDKAHLVPFGEYLPFRPVLGALGMTKLAHGMTDFSAGPGPRTFDIPGLPPVSLLVCYEAIFPSEVVGPPGDISGLPPAWLLVLTNDAWFGVSTGPYQHFAMTRLRAVEQGLPMLRAANTGISAIVDPYGRVVASLGLGEGGVLDGDLPKPVPGKTLFAAYGSVPALLAMIAMVLLFGANRPPIRKT